MHACSETRRIVILTATAVSGVPKSATMVSISISQQVSHVLLHPRRQHTASGEHMVSGVHLDFGICRILRKLGKKHSARIR